MEVYLKTLFHLIGVVCALWMARTAAELVNEGRLSDVKRPFTPSIAGWGGLMLITFFGVGLLFQAESATRWLPWLLALNTLQSVFYFSRLDKTPFPQFMSVKQADEIVSKLADTLAGELPKSVRLESQLPAPRDDVKKAFRVILVSLVELQMRTGKGQKKAIEWLLNGAAHIYDFASPATAALIDSKETSEAKRHYRIFTAEAVSAGMAFVEELRELSNAVLKMDVSTPEFRQQVNKLAGIQTRSPLEDRGASVFRDH